MFNSTDSFTMPVVPANYSNNCNGNGMWGDGAWWIILLFLAFGWGGFGGFGNGYGAYGGGINTPAGQGYATRADINEGFAFNNLQRDVNSIQNGICDSTYALTNAINNGFSNTQMQLCNGFNGVQTQISNLGYQLQDCCCQTQRAIDGVNYNMATNTCNLQNTMNNNARDIIDNQNAGTRAIIDALTQQRIEAKDERIAELQSLVNSLNLSQSQANQNAVLMAAMDANTAQIIRRTGNDCPIPAYVVPNPNCCYGTPYGVLNNGCGCNSGCGCV